MVRFSGAMWAISLSKMLLPSLVGTRIMNLVLCSNVHIELDDDMIQ